VSAPDTRIHALLRTIWTPVLLSGLMVAIWLVVTYIVDDVFYTQ
jgi:hypothetical protein